MINSTFVENRILGHCVNLDILALVELNNITCANTSNLNSMEIFNGGCFRTKDIISRSFINILIFNITSDLTTFGIKIIDFDFNIEYLTHIYNNTIEKKVILIDKEY